MRTFLCAMAVATGALAQYSGSLATDKLINEAIQQGKIPGAVLIVGHQGQIVYEKAYGKRALMPSTEAMTVDTVFDCASLTKVVATTSSIMKLFEEGKLRLNDRVTEYIPEFEGGKSTITVRNLLTHFSGLRPDLTLTPEWHGYDTGIKLAVVDKPTGSPGARFVYSDINFILLGEIVHRISGQLVSDYARQNIFLPLGMTETQYLPPAALVPRIAPTEVTKTGLPLRGTVHDETTRYMGGVAGHAGLFSTAQDLAKFCQMLLNLGALNGTKIFSPLTVIKFTTPQSPPDQAILRGLGWDIDSPFSGNRGELFPVGSYGHTGFTGTSLWIDPSTQTYVVLLTNSVHPRRGQAITALRGKVATVAAASVGIAKPGIILNGYNETLSGAGIHREVGRTVQTLTGLDVLKKDGFQVFKGKRIGLITNHTGLDRDGNRNIDVIRAAGITIGALFSPEHGFLGVEDRKGLTDSVDPKTGVKVHSLYGKTERPTPEMLKGLDALVFDIQDVGTRFYTYTTTMAYCMESAAKAGIPYYVLDRPNPITGTHVEGQMIDQSNLSFVGYYPIPLRHGMTMGELAKLFNGEKQINANLTVIEMDNWQRGDWLDATTVPWVNPSPNMRSLAAALLYPGVGMLEYSKNYSVGRGTESPFEHIGAEFINGKELAAYLNQRVIPGIRVYPTTFTPTSSNLANKKIQGIRFMLTGREQFDSGRFGLEIAAALQKLYPGKIDFTLGKKLIGSDATIKMLAAGDDPRAIQEKGLEEVQAFLPVREKYLIYK